MPITPQTNIQKPVIIRISTSSSNNTTLTNLLLIHTNVSNNSNQPAPSIAKTTTISGKDIVIGRTSKNGYADVSNSQPPPLPAPANTIKLYKIEKIIQVKKNRTNVVNAIKVLSDNGSNNKDNDNPLPNTGNKAKNDFKDYTYNKEENNPNTTFFRQIYVHIFLIYLIQILP